MRNHLDFFYFLGSTYTYLAVNRAEDIAARHNVILRWRPFSVRTLMREQNNIPFANKPAKLKYMWRDIERRALRHGVPFKAASSHYPIDADELANRVATLAAMEGWCPVFTQAAYATWFLENKDPGEIENLSAILLRIGQDPAAVIARANGDAVRGKYVSETGEARKLGIFGSPTFACGTEIFWGDDRLEEAIEWCTSH
ncbi:2-hydroxychromene-2-carboxylate isomerase [Azohydromonas caseinilytica]|uniref:2-hydroxychromene-2-carboxylate isomerase n=1 Tax=Azohydromonas caseinilytica TaxID=2728836 RepID=A0A848FJ13_9BURK|nr:DsbA family protein [Azohydromonas caseinilytica]NML17821.1 2-hydroxychromene-2-carboxylate isomerase [Azohydromonas caseinilytica]